MKIGRTTAPVVVPKRVQRKVVRKKKETPVYIPIKSPAKKEENVPA